MPFTGLGVMLRLKKRNKAGNDGTTASKTESVLANDVARYAIGRLEQILAALGSYKVIPRRDIGEYRHALPVCDAPKEHYEVG
jgi:hypothetical protein